MSLVPSGDQAGSLPCAPSGCGLLPSAPLAMIPSWPTYVISAGAPWASASAASTRGNENAMTRILAQLSVRRGSEALAFYAQAFGAVVDYQVGDESIVAQLSVGDATFWVSDESPENGHASPETLGGTSLRLLLLVDDPQAAFTRAVSAGAT